MSIAMQGDFGKPRSALVIQANQFDEHATVTVLPVTSTLVAAPLLRITIQPNAENGLQKPSQAMVDKAITVKRGKVGPTFGRINMHALLEVERCLAVFLGMFEELAACLPRQQFSNTRTSTSSLTPSCTSGE